MRSGVLDAELATAIDQVTAGMDAVVAAGVDPVDHRDAAVVIQELEVLHRRLRTMQVEVMDRIEARGLHRFDGHASAKVMVRHVAKLSNAEAHRRAVVARALRDLPVVRAAFAQGQIGVCQVERIARAHANGRVRERLCRQDDAMAVLAASVGYERFDATVTDWVRRVDEDGTCDRSQRSHENRDAKLVQDFDGSWVLSAGCGSLQGLELQSILRRFVEAEFATDWDKARTEHGLGATVEHLVRTDGQRRFDALFEIFQRAASAHAHAEGGSVVVTDVVVDQATFERQLRRFSGADPSPVAESLDQSEGSLGFRCSSLDGRPVDASEAVAAALIGHVRRVVIGADRTVIDLGRRRRLFTGSAHLAAKLCATECYWPGCHVPVSGCQIDHLLPWADHGGGSGGSTDPGNGGPACGRHNRLKQRGFSVHRDATGHWHIYRSDGTEIE